MRITCPNCAAEYEVDASLVPETGRDVQCSACGHTWMQFRDGHTEEVGPPETGAVSHTAPDAASEGGDGPARDIISEPDPAPDAQPDLPPDDPVSTGSEADAEADRLRPPRRELDEEARRILREEAAREAARRRERREARIETQTELGLEPAAPRLHDPAPPEPVVPEPVAPEPAPADDAIAGNPDPVAALGDPSPDGRRGRTRADAERAAANRGDLFPDIEEINSTLAPDQPPAPDRAVEPRGSDDHAFRRGFVTMLAIGAFLILIYALAPRLALAIPEMEPALAGYVAAVNGFRLGVEDLLQSAAAWLQGLTGDAAAA